MNAVPGRRRGLVLVSIFLLTLLCAAVPSARACSMCRCGDATFNALGTDVYVDGKVRVSFDWERFDKDQGAADVQESMRENRFTTSLSYTFFDRVTAVARGGVRVGTAAGGVVGTACVDVGATVAATATAVGGVVDTAAGAAVMAGTAVG